MSKPPPKNTFTYAYGTNPSQLMVVPFPRERVKQWLPPGIELGTPPWMGGDQHPVVLLWSRMTNVRVHPVPSFLINMTYGELGIGVPWTHATEGNLGYEGPAFFCGLFYVEDKLPLALGRLGGLPKYRAKVVATDTEYEVRQWRRDHMLAKLDWTAHEGAAPDDIRQRVISAMSQPLVTRKSPTLGGDITWYGMRWFLDEAPMRPIKAKATLRTTIAHTELAWGQETYSGVGWERPDEAICLESDYAFHLNGPITDGSQLPLYLP